MKKKILSLLMAAAVVATTAIPANAQVYEDNDTETIDANVKVTGTISDDKGNAPAGRIQVEVPTTLSFTVDASRNFKQATNYTITNKSQSAIEVLVGSFKETKPNAGITLSVDDPGSKDRSNIKLTLRGNQNNEINLAQVDATTLLSEIDPKGSDTLQLNGVVGTGTTSDTGVDQDGATEDFELVFKIRKSVKPGEAN